MKALFVHSGNMYGGVERVLEAVAGARHLCPDLEPRFALCFEGRVAASLRATGVRVDLLGPVRLTRPGLVMRARTRLATLIRAERPDVMVTPSVWTHALFAPVARRLRVPLALWVHDALSGRPWLEKLAARHQPDLLLCNSHYTESAARAVFPSVSAEVVRCPLLFDSLPHSRRDVRQSLATPDAAVVIVSVARMQPSKGHQFLVEALAQLPADLPWRCWMVGGAQQPTEMEYERSLRESIRTRGLEERVLLLGQRTDVSALLAAADVSCQPSQGPETFGLALVEALHAGLPVVATKLGGPIEIVTDACGQLVPAGDTGALADVLSCLVTDPDARKRLGTAGPARALALCSPGPRLAELNRALHGILERAAA